MNLFSKGNSFPIISIGKFLSQLYVTILSRRAISSRRFFQRLNPRQVVLRIDTCRVKTFCYASRRVVRANHSESIVRPSEVRSTLISKKREVHITPEVKDYVTLVVYKNSLIDFSSVSNPTLVVSKCNDIISVSLRQ